jgi:hypothetical protein
VQQHRPGIAATDLHLTQPRDRPAIRGLLATQRDRLLVAVAGAIDGPLAGQHERRLLGLLGCLLAILALAARTRGGRPPTRWGLHNPRSIICIV